MHKFISYKTVCVVSDNESEIKFIRGIWAEQSFPGNRVWPPVLEKHVLCFRRDWKLWKMPNCSTLVACQVVTQGNLARYSLVFTRNWVYTMEQMFSMLVVSIFLESAKCHLKQKPYIYTVENHHVILSHFILAITSSFPILIRDLCFLHSDCFMSCLYCIVQAWRHRFWFNARFLCPSLF